MHRLLASMLIVPGFVFLGLALLPSPATHGFGFYGVMYGLFVLVLRGGGWLAKSGIGRWMAALLPTLGVFALIAAYSFLAIDPMLLAGVVAALLLMSMFMGDKDRTMRVVAVAVALTTLASGWVA